MRWSIVTYRLFSVLFVIAALFLTACGDDGSSEGINQANKSGVEIVSSASDLPKCTKKNEGEQAWIRGELSPRICVDEKWFATLDSTNRYLHCSFEELKNKSALKIICDGDSIGILPYTNESGSGIIDTTVLDSEKIATSLDGVYGFSQKGPFLMGSNVKVVELESGRTLNQTGFSFESKIQSDDGQFKLNARLMKSQYLELHADGYYRNEVTGKNSDAPLTLYAITDVMMRSGGLVNINLLTHLEYHRVLYLVKNEKMKVADAKNQAQKEVFAVLNIDGTGFSNSEDLNIVGSSDEDGALLAFSVMFQGDRSVAALTELLSKVATDLEKDGKWSDAKTRMEIAEWSADADSSGKFSIIRDNVMKWNLSTMLPKFEHYIRHFWTTEYGLGDCTTDSLGIVKPAKAGKRKDTETRYICKEDSTGELRWLIANDFEKDTYEWEAGENGEVRVGSVTGTEYYLYDANKNAWREATIVEQQLGGCTPSVAANTSKNNGFVNGYWYICKGTEWKATTAFIVDTQGWISGSDGDVVKGDNTDTYYVYDKAEKKWRKASENDVILGLMGCTTNRTGQMGLSSYDQNFYSCAKTHKWVLLENSIAYNTEGIPCDEDGKMVAGLVDERSLFVCDGGSWREATSLEESENTACTAATEGIFNRDSTLYCENSAFRIARPFDFPIGKDWTNKNLEYGELKDDRDGRVYKTIVINGIKVMAENLNYADSSKNRYLMGNNWCYKNDSINCIKGGRYYSWTAAVDIDPKWKATKTPYGMIQKTHRGICPKGWHIPVIGEWYALFDNISYYEMQATGNFKWPEATNESGFSALPVANHDDWVVEDMVFGGTRFWSATEYPSENVFGESIARWSINHDGVDGFTNDKGSRISLRCFEDYDPSIPLFNSDSTKFFEYGRYRDAIFYDFPVEKKWINLALGYDFVKDDRDQRIYKTIKIGDLVWMAENLNYADSITTPTLKANNHCYQEDSLNCLKGGRYYTWTAAMNFGRKWQEMSVPPEMIGKQHRGICPEGWHIPSKEEWDKSFPETSYEKLQAVDIVGWDNATNESGFSAIPAGWISKYSWEGKDGKVDIGTKALFWLSNEGKNTVLEPNNSNYDDGHGKDNALSVRCVKDYPEE